MLHAILLYNDGKHIFRTASHTFMISGLNGLSGTTSDDDFRSLRSKLEGKGGYKVMFTSEELKAVYSGMSILESEGWENGAMQQADRWINENHPDQQFHPELGREPRERFRSLQKQIREELAAAR